MHTSSAVRFLGTARCASSPPPAEATRRPKPPPTHPRSGTVPVRTAAVTSRDLVETLTLTGTLDPRAQVTVVAEVSARLEQMLKTEGDRVTRGQLLAVLDDVDFKLARDRAQAAVNVADANRAHAKAEKERADSLLKTGGITDKDRLSAEAVRARRPRPRRAANGHLRTVAGAFAWVAPPTDASSRMADAGAMLQAGTALLRSSTTRS